MPPACHVSTMYLHAEENEQSKETTQKKKNGTFVKWWTKNKNHATDNVNPNYCFHNRTFTKRSAQFSAPSKRPLNRVEKKNDLCCYRAGETVPARPPLKKRPLYETHENTTGLTYLFVSVENGKSSASLTREISIACLRENDYFYVFCFFRTDAVKK